MKKSRLIRTSACVLAALTLSGCQGILGKLGFSGKGERPTEAAAPIFGEDELEQGRLALKAGYPAAAIQQFRLAALNEAAAPEAFNGLGVAYARLGRADLAERYFQTALSMDSANPKFAANLERFYNSPLGQSARALAMRQQEAQATLAAAAEAAEAQGLIEPAATPERRGAVTIERPAVQLTRSSARELQIATRTPAKEGDGSGEMATVAVRNSAAPASAAADAPRANNGAVPGRARISLLGTRGSPESYPVRIQLARPQTSGATRPRAASYPVRIPLGQADRSE